ncbi:MAG: GAF domain-containing protein, partial [Nocardioidaceae bacterium]
MPMNPAVRQAMEDVARHLHRAQDVDQTLSMLTKSALETIHGIDYVSITLRQDGGLLTTIAPTDPVAVAIDTLQYELHEGPCYEAVSDGEQLLIANDLADDSRWAVFGPRAADLGVGGLLVLELVADGSSRAAL